MLPNRPTAPALAALLLASVCASAIPAGARAQEPYSPLVPRGNLRLGVLGQYASFSDLYEIPGLAGGPHRLGGLFSGPAGSRIFPFLTEPEAAVRAAIDDDYEMSLGTMSSVLEKSAAWVPISADVGAFDWLTVGATVPLVQSETEFTTTFAADSASATAGFSPALEDPAAVTGFLSGLQGSIGAYDVIRGEACAADPASDPCRDATALVADARAFHSLLSQMYGSVFAPLAWSDAGAALQGRLAALSEAFQAAGVPGVVGLPLASALLTAEDVERLVAEPGFGIESTHPLGNWRSLWRLGDIEVRADARAFQTGEPDAPTRLTVGGGAMVRLPTGTQDDPANFLDSGSGDRQMDIEARAWINGRWRGRLGLWADVRYGVQMPGSTVRRVFDPAVALAPRVTEVALDWNPGDYQFVELSPWFRIADPLTITAGYRLFRKADDSFSLPTVVVVDEEAAPAPAQQVDPQILVPGSGGSVGQALLGMVYNPAAHVADDGAPGAPFEIRAIYRRAVGGSGLMPATHSFEVGFRLFVGVWGG